MGLTQKFKPSLSPEDTRRRCTASIEMTTAPFFITDESFNNNNDSI